MLLTKIRRRFYGMLKDRKGQSTTEYILILAIVVMIASKLRKSLTSSSDTIMQNFDNKAQDFFRE
jgi:hypothetical protein